jgi:hypothetical protein
MIEASLLAHYKAKLDKAIEYYVDMFHDKAVRLGADEETMARFMQELRRGVRAVSQRWPQSSQGWTMRSSGTDHLGATDLL